MRVKIPKGKPLGSTYYIVQSELDPMVFTHHRDASSFKKLLKASTRRLDSDIVRREVTGDGYDVTY